MKELSVEEKAKRYDEALRKIRILQKIIGDATLGNLVLKNEFENIFPELKESDDERIRKALLEMVHDTTGDELWVDYNVHKEEALAWLEKQSEQNQKHLELKAGHWYICHRAYCCRADHLTVNEGERFMCEKDGVVKGFVIKEPEKYFKEVCAPAPIEDEKKPEVDQHSLPVSDDSSLPTSDESIYHPCTEKVYEQNTAWSEEDEKILNLIIARLHSHPNVEAEEYGKDYHWLKDLRPQLQWKPSDEKMEALESATENCAYSEYQDCLRELIEQLKKLREE